MTTLPTIEDMMNEPTLISAAIRAHLGEPTIAAQLGLESMPRTFRMRQWLALKIAPWLTRPTVKVHGGAVEYEVDPRMTRPFLSPTCPR